MSETSLRERFGDIGLSLYTLFQIMTLESWSMGIARPVMQQFPYAWAFFIPFILVATFTMLNLFIAIIFRQGPRCGPCIRSCIEERDFAAKQRHPPPKGTTGVDPKLKIDALLY